MKFSIVKLEDRLDFFPELVANNIHTLMRFENSLYQRMEDSCDAYSGGTWEFIRFENGAMVAVYEMPDLSNIPEECKHFDEDGELEFIDLNKMFPVANVHTIVPQLNYFMGEMSLFALSFAVNLALCSNFSFLTKGKTSHKLANNYHLLYEAIAEFKEVGAIAGYLD